MTPAREYGAGFDASGESGDGRGKYRGSGGRLARVGVEKCGKRVVEEGKGRMSKY